MMIMLLFVQSVSRFIEAHPSLKILALSFLIMIDSTDTRRISRRGAKAIHLHGDGIFTDCGAHQHQTQKMSS